jgi:hypothetical protein
MIFCLGCICGEQSNPLKQSNQDFEQLLQPTWVSRGKKPVVKVKCHQLLRYLVANSISRSGFVKHLTKPLPVDNVPHGESPSHTLTKFSTLQ